MVIVYGGGVSTKIKNASDVIINPATEEKQDDIISGIPITTNDAVVSVQNPFTIDSDSVYVKDIDSTNSDIGTFTGTIISLFDDITTVITDTSATNPKHFTVKLNRPLKTGQLNISTQTGNYSNVKIIFYDASGAIRYTHDDSSNDTKYTKNHYDFPPITISGFKIEFHTIDAVNVGFVFIQKSISVIARLQGINIEGIREDAGIVHNHIKNIGFHESIGHSSTNTAIEIERCMGRKEDIGEGAFTLLEEAPFVQPPGDTQMYIQSTSAQDSAAGTGAQQITVEYFEYAWGTKKTVQIVPEGLNQVAFTVSNIYRIHKAYINKGGNAVGLITITNSDESELYGQISIYHAFMQRCIFYVGENEKVTCTELVVSSYSKEGIIGRLFASEEDADGNVIPRARIIHELAGGPITYPFEISETVSNPNNKRIAIGLAVTGIAAAQTATGTLKGFNEPL